MLPAGKAKKNQKQAGIFSSHVSPGSWDIRMAQDGNHLLND
jgi:hypothetical protein